MVYPSRNKQNFLNLLQDQGAYPHTRFLLGGLQNAEFKTVVAGVEEQRYVNLVHGASAAAEQKYVNVPSWHSSGGGAAGHSTTDAEAFIPAPYNPLIALMRISSQIEASSGEGASPDTDMIGAELVRLKDVLVSDLVTKPVADYMYSYLCGLERSSEKKLSTELSSVKELINERRTTLSGDVYEIDEITLRAALEENNIEHAHFCILHCNASTMSRTPFIQKTANAKDDQLGTNLWSYLHAKNPTTTLNPRLLRRALIYAIILQNSDDIEILLTKAKTQNINLLTDEDVYARLDAATRSELGIDANFEGHLNIMSLAILAGVDKKSLVLCCGGDSLETQAARKKAYIVANKNNASDARIVLEKSRDILSLLFLAREKEFGDRADTVTSEEVNINLTVAAFVDLRSKPKSITGKTITNGFDVTTTGTIIDQDGEEIPFTYVQNTDTLTFGPNNTTVQNQGSLEDALAKAWEEYVEILAKLENISDIFKENHEVISASYNRDDHTFVVKRKGGKASITGKLERTVEEGSQQSAGYVLLKYTVSGLVDDKPFSSSIDANSVRTALELTLPDELGTYIKEKESVATGGGLADPRRNTTGRRASVTAGAGLTINQEFQKKSLNVGDVIAVRGTTSTSFQIMLADDTPNIIIQVQKGKGRQGKTVTITQEGYEPLTEGSLTPKMNSLEIALKAFSELPEERTKEEEVIGFGDEFEEEPDTPGTNLPPGSTGGIKREDRAASGKFGF